MTDLKISFILIFICFALFTVILASIIAKKTALKSLQVKDNKHLNPAEKLLYLIKKCLPEKYINFAQKLTQKACFDNFTSDKLILIQISLCFFIFISLIVLSRFFTEKPFLAFAVSILVGSGIPVLFIHKRFEKIQQKINEEIPFFADSLTLSCEAGLDIFASLNNMLAFLGESPLREKIESMLKEVKMGKSRQTALRHAYSNTENWGLKTIFLTISQAESLGTPVGKSLRNQVEILRHERLNRAEKHAQEAPLKLMIPLLLCIFPVTLSTLVSPIILRFLRGEIL